MVIILGLHLATCWGKIATNQMKWISLWPTRVVCLLRHWLRSPLELRRGGRLCTGDRWYTACSFGRMRPQGFWGKVGGFTMVYHGSPTKNVGGSSSTYIGPTWLILSQLIPGWLFLEADASRSPTAVCDQRKEPLVFGRHVLVATWLVFGGETEKMWLLDVNMQQV